MRDRGGEERWEKKGREGMGSGKEVGEREEGEIGRGGGVKVWESGEGIRKERGKG